MARRTRGDKSQPPVETLRIDQITIGDRYRTDLGDIDSLAASIDDIGLLHVPVVTPTGRLIAGRRRIVACESLGWESVPVRVIDLDEVARGEFDENTIRKDFTPSEAVAIARALRPDEQAAAAGRMSEGGRGDKLSPLETGKARERVARRVGMSHGTLARAEKVVAAAETDPEQHADLVEQMDRDGKVDPAYRILQERERQAEWEQSDEKHDLDEADEFVKKVNKNAPADFDPEAEKQRMSRTQGLYRAIDLLAGLPDPAAMIEDVREWEVSQLAALPEAVAWLNQFAEAWETTHGN